MWERQIATAKWNGLAFNIQSTTLDNGKRLHVVELPYADEPYINVMGAKVKGVNLDAVFVGLNSLVDANAFVAGLEDDPIGTLEHPYLGEMSLVYESSSQSFNTKKGLVTLSLKFLRQGASVVLTAQVASAKTVEGLSDDVRVESQMQLVRDMTIASADEISSMQFDFNNLLTTLRSIASRATSSSMKLTRLHHQIQDAINAINTIASAPAAFSDQLSAIIDNLKSVLLDEKSSASSSSPGNMIVNLNEFAVKGLSSCINTDSNFSHCNDQIIVALVLLNEELEFVGPSSELQLETFIDNLVNNVSADDADINTSISDSSGNLTSGASDSISGSTATLINNSLNNASDNINLLIEHLDNLVNDATRTATYESLALSEAINVLREFVVNQYNKVSQYCQRSKTITLLKPCPLLSISQSQECDSMQLSALNSIVHPLFVSGEVRLPNE